MAGVEAGTAEVEAHGVGRVLDAEWGLRFRLGSACRELGEWV